MNNIPEGATHKDEVTGIYYKYSDMGDLLAYLRENDKWGSSSLTLSLASEFLSPLRENSFYNNMTECRRCGGAFDHKMHGECPCLKDVHGMPDADNVNHPEHYQSESGIECIDAIRAAVGDDGFVAHCRATAIKYCWRSGKKRSHAEDLRKAAWYLDKAASVIEGRG